MDITQTIFFKIMSRCWVKSQFPNEIETLQNHVTNVELIVVSKLCYRVFFFYPSLSPCPCNQLIKSSAQHLSLRRFTMPEKLKSRTLSENGDPCRQPPAHWVRGGWEWGQSPNNGSRFYCGAGLGTEPQTSKASLPAQPVWVHCEWLRDNNCL